MKSFAATLLSVGDILRHRDVYFYLETANDWLHIGLFAEKLLKNTQAEICFLCSKPVAFEAEIVSQFPGRVTFFNIGTGMLRSFLLPQLSAKLVVMTLTDLGSPQLRKSHNVADYLYIFHSVTSTHMCYPATAFDEYDTIFCVGPHHKKEIRTRERLHSLNRKRLVDFGHSSIERLRTFAASHSRAPDPKRIVIAPSWGPSSLVETLPAEFYQALLDAGFTLYVRLHSMSINRKKLFAADIESLAQANPNMDLDYSHLDMQALANCSTMISDWSGAATEFAFGFQRPVIFIDTPRKVRNAHYEDLKLKPLEVGIRDKIGKVVAIEDAYNIANWLPDFLGEKNLANLADLIEQQYRKNVFTENSSWMNGLKALEQTHGQMFAYNSSSNIQPDDESKFTGHS